MNEKVSKKTRIKIEDSGHNKIGVYTFYDTESKLYDIPTYIHSDILANRYYNQVIEREPHLKKVITEEMDFLRLGWFNKNNGEFTYEPYVIKSHYKEEK